MISNDSLNWVEAKGREDKVQSPAVNARVPAPAAWVEVAFGVTTAFSHSLPPKVMPFHFGVQAKHAHVVLEDGAYVERQKIEPEIAS